jgi:outer membrane autotransporter protein
VIPGPAPTPSINNSGDIIATALDLDTGYSYASAYGIYTGSLGDGASINNSGNIIAAASGITYASAYGIEVYDMTAGASINNSGTITALVASDSDSGSAYGIYVSGTMDADATITNSGTITAAGPMNDLAYSIYIGSGSGNVINSGMLTGSIDLGGTVSLTNTGTLDIPADGGYGYVGGDYDQTDGGMLKIGVQDATDYGYLQVDGTATLEDDANIRVNLMPDNELVNGDTLDDVIDASLGTLDSGPDYNVTDNSLPWRFAAVADGDTIDLTVTRTGMTTYVAAVKSDDLNSAKGVAGILDNFYEQGAPNADFDELLYTLGSLNRASEVADGVSKLLPLMSGGLPQAALNALHSSNRIIQARQDETSGLSSGDPAQAAKAVWLKPFGSWADQDDRDGAIGYDADTAGLVIGVDTLAFTNFRLGAAFIYANSDVDSNSSVAPQNADIDTYEIAFYGSYSIDDRTDLNFQADIGQGSYDGKRTIHIGPSNSIAKSDYDSTNYHLGVGVGREIKINDKTSLIPSMRVDYTAINEDGYTEKGSGPFNLKVDSNDTEELVFALEGKINHSLTPALTLSGNLGLGYDAISDEASITSSFVDGGGNFVTDGIDPSPFMLRAGLGVELTPWTNGLAIVARYEVEAREDFTNQTVSMKLRKSF